MADASTSIGGQSALDIGGIFTPDSILSAAERVAAAARALAAEIFDAQPDVDDDFFARWSSFYAAFTAWKAGNSSWFSRVWNTTRDELQDFVGQYNSLHDEWAAAHGTHAEGFTVKTDSIADAAERAGAAAGVALKSVAYGLAVVVAVPLLGYLAYRLAGKS
ncbi:MAG TPA: hypothetical protein VIF11_15800 [Methylomirabilota bacterium]|jgi:hypothetical protein